MQHPDIAGLSEWKLLSRAEPTEVWQARQLSPDRLVAVKVFQRELADDERRRFLREAAAAGRLSDHPGMVTTYDAGTLPDGRPYLIMELCPGGSLTEWLKPENRPSEEQVRQVGLRIADALAAAHACGVLHRNVTPANILIGDDGEPRLADFGLLALLGADADPAETPPVPSRYAPPEAFRMQPATESSDVFSLAATLYALLAGSPPAVGSAVEHPRRAGHADTRGQPGLDGRGAGCLGRGSRGSADRREVLRPAGEGAAAHVKRGRFAGAGQGCVERVNTVARPTPGRDPGPGRVGGRDRLGNGLADQRARFVGRSAPRRRNVRLPADAVERQPVTGRRGPHASDLRPRRPRPRRRRPRPRSSPAQDKTIQLEDPADSAKPFETVPIQGTYRGGADTILRVQRWESGRWLAFPVPTKTDQSGQFTAYVELGRLGSSPASHAGSRLGRDVQTLGAGDQGLTTPPVSHAARAPPPAGRRRRRCPGTDVWRRRTCHHR